MRETGSQIPLPLGGDESPTLGALAAALAKAQGAMGSARKDSENPHFKSRYADLASIWDACRAPLSANGLAVMQRVKMDAAGVIITTMLVHSSGEWVKDACLFPLAQRTIQVVGSTITYGRRYALAALVGVAPDEDDDGEAATGRETSGRRDAPQQASARNTKTEAVKERLKSQAPKPDASTAEFDAVVASIREEATVLGVEEGQLAAGIAKLKGVSHAKDWLETLRAKRRIFEGAPAS